MSIPDKICLLNIPYQELVLTCQRFNTNIWISNKERYLLRLTVTRPISMIRAIRKTANNFILYKQSCVTLCLWIDLIFWDVNSAINTSELINLCSLFDYEPPFKHSHKSQVTYVKNVKRNNLNLHCSKHFRERNILI